MYETPTKITISDENIINKLSSIVNPEVRDGSYYDPSPYNPCPVDQRAFTTSAEKLELIKSGLDREEYSNCFLEKDRLFVRMYTLPVLSELQSWVEQQFPDYTFSKSNGIVYPPGGYLGWHTNAERPGLRFYLHWVDEVGQSSFKYWDGEKVVEDVENEKCFIRIFNITDMTDPLWHCVSSNTFRVSVGFYMEAK